MIPETNISIADGILLMSKSEYIVSSELVFALLMSASFSFPSGLTEIITANANMMVLSNI